MKDQRKVLIYGMVLSALVFGMTSLAGALPITLVDGDWQNAAFSQRHVSYTITNSGASGGTSTIYWGEPATWNGQSGYIFKSRQTTFDSGASGSVFALGTFTHQNQPIYADGGSLTSVDLLTSLGISDLKLSVTLNFDHDETPNTSNPTQSRDIVTIQNPIVDKEFTYGGSTYYFSLLGFSTDTGATISSTFYTWEGQANNATLYAKITLKPISSPPVSTPEPGTLLLFGIALMGLKVVMREKKHNI